MTGTDHAGVRHAAVSDHEISVQRMASIVADPHCGAFVTFDGVVRDHDGGKGVLRLGYTAHPSAQDVLAEVAQEVTTAHPEVLIAVTHRAGLLTVGETALACAVSAPHRAAAFAACDALVDLVKQRVPIWKHQEFTDGTEEWVGALG